MKRETMKLSGAVLQKLIDHSEEGIAIMSAEGTPLFLSPSIEKILGYSPEEVVGQIYFHYYMKMI